jgi:ribosome-binding factor A
MASIRLGRTNDDIQRVLSELLRRVKDPRVQQGMLSVTRVETTGDLRYAKVWLSVLGEVEEKQFMKGSDPPPAGSGMNSARYSICAIRPS